MNDAIKNDITILYLRYSFHGYEKHEITSIRDECIKFSQTSLSSHEKFQRRVENIKTILL